MESRACSFSDNSVVSFDVTMGVEGEEMGNPSRAKYLQTSTPFVRSKPPVSGKVSHTSLDTCEELNEQSCCSPQDMSLEASAINASTVTATSSARLSKSDESDSLVNDNSENLTGSATSASEMNAAFWGSSLKGLSDSSSNLPESSTASRVSSEYSIVEETVAVDLTVQGMLNKSFTETEPSDGVCELRGHSDETTLDRSEIENSGVTTPTVETASADLNERSTAIAVEAAQVQVKDSVARSSSFTSIYLDDGTAKSSKPSKATNPPKRLTMAQRATMEAMAAFGGSNLGSVQVRRVDLHAQLKGEAEARKRKQEEEREEGQPLAKRTRLQVAKLEAEETFRHVPLGGGVRSQRKVASKNGIGKKEGSGRPYQSRVARARAEAYETFGGVSLDKLPPKRSRGQRPVECIDGPVDGCKAAPRLTRVEQARLEALKSFSGSSLTDTLGTSKRRVARTLEAREKKDENGGGSSGEAGSEDKENCVVQA